METKNHNIARFGLMSLSQEILFLHYQIFPNFNPLICRVVKIDGKFDQIAHCDAIGRMIECHEPLRSRWTWKGKVPKVEVLLPEKIMEICQPQIWDSSRKDLIRTGKDALHSSIKDATPNNGCPMSNALIRVSEDEWYWIFIIHHFSADAWSLKYYSQTFSDEYNRNDYIENIYTTSIEYAQLQRKWLMSNEAQSQFDWWIDRLSNLAPQAVPIRCNFKLSKIITNGERQGLTISKYNKESLIATSKKWNCSLSAIIFSVLGKLIATRLQEELVSFMSNVAGRTLRNSSKSSGAFYNSVIFTFPVPKLATDCDLAILADQSIHETLERQEIPLAVINFGEISGGGIDLTNNFPISLNFIEHPLSGFSMNGCLVRDVKISTFEVNQNCANKPEQIVGYDSFSNKLSFAISLFTNGIRIEAEYFQGAFSQEEVRELLKSYTERLVKIAKMADFTTSEPLNQECTDSLGSIVGDWREL